MMIMMIIGGSVPSFDLGARGKREQSTDRQDVRCALIRMMSCVHADQCSAKASQMME